ncbi:UNVERIFIED_CONTAM: hypothetical protein Sradi_2990700 [Sesamum radiatum]|uniref:Uncharacterized protein n=1 Tax=Sesamum radiatum TaxID=300843 RepID=A0AAW2S0L9_SESRA
MLLALNQEEEGERTSKEGEPPYGWDNRSYFRRTCQWRLNASKKGSNKGSYINATNAINHVAYSEVVTTQYENPKGEITFSDQDLEGHLPASNDAIVISATEKSRCQYLWGHYPRRATKFIKFLVVDSPSAYNMILGSPSLNMFRAVASTYHLKIKFPTPDGIGEEIGDRRQARECYANTSKNPGDVPRLKAEKQKRLPRMTPDKHKKQTPHGEAASKSLEENKRRKIELERMEAIEEMKMIEFFGDPSKAIKIGSSLGLSFERDLVNFLKEHSDVFAWEASNMQGISPEVMVHKLNVHPEERPIKQKKRAFGTDRNRIIKEEVEKLLKIDYIRPVQYPEWLANVVLVPKSNEKWRMCIDFMDLIEHVLRTRSLYLGSP